MAYEHISYAKLLAKRNRVRLNPNRTPIEKETDSLFFWIMSRLEDSVENCHPAKSAHIVTLSIPILDDDDYVILKHRDLLEYRTMYVTGKDFYTVLKHVVDLFNEVGLSKIEGYYYFAYVSNYSPFTALEFSVIMATE